MRARRIAAVVFTLAVLVMGCGDDDRSDAAGDTAPQPKTKPTLNTRPTVPPTTAAPTTIPPTTVPARPALPVGRPATAGDPAALASQLVTAHEILRDPTSPPDQLDAAAHLQQVAYRQLGRHPEWDADVLALVPPALAHVGAVARRRPAAVHGHGHPAG